MARRCGRRRCAVRGAGARGYLGVSERAARGPAPAAGPARPAAHAAARAEESASPGGTRLGPASPDGVGAERGAAPGTWALDRRLRGAARLDCGSRPETPRRMGGETTPERGRL